MREAYRMLNEEQAIKADAFADDFVLEQNPQMPGTRGTFQGADGAEASLDELLSGFDSIRFEPQGFEPYGDWLIVSISWWGSARGVEQRLEIFHIWHMRDGRATRLRVLGGGADPHREIDKLGE